MSSLIKLVYASLLSHSVVAYDDGDKVELFVNKVGPYFKNFGYFSYLLSTLHIFS